MMNAQNRKQPNSANLLNSYYAREKSSFQRYYAGQDKHSPCIYEPYHLEKKTVLEELLTSLMNAIVEK